MPRNESGCRNHWAGTCCRKTADDWILLCGVSSWVVRTDTKRIQNIAQGYDAFEVVYVSAANDGQEFEPGRAHALKRQIKRLIRVGVRKSACIHKLT